MQQPLVTEECNFVPLSSTLFSSDNALNANYNKHNNHNVRKDENMRQWLGARLLVKRFNHKNDINIWGDSFNKILGLFGRNKQELIYFLIDNANSYQLNGIIEILSLQLSKNRDRNNKTVSDQHEHVHSKNVYIMIIFHIYLKHQ